MNVRVIFHYQDPEGQPLAGVHLSATSVHGPWTGVTDGAGNFDTGEPTAGYGLAPGDYLVTASKPGFITDNYDGHPVHIQFPGTINRALQRATGHAPFTIHNRDFVDATGKRLSLSGTDQFLALRQHMDGVPLAPALEETHRIGFTLWRVFLQGSIAQNNVMQLSPTEPGYYDKLASLVALLNGEGITLLATIGVDNQDIKSPISHWVKVGQILQGSNAIISNFNEWTKNHGDIDPGAIPAPNHPFWSRGSDQQDAPPFKPAGTVIEFHPVRNYTTAMRDTVASPIELYEVQGYTQPLIIDEPTKMGTNGSELAWTLPQNCENYARLASTLCAGVVFHNWFGQRGLLMDGLTVQCAQAFQRGMRL